MKEPTQEQIKEFWAWCGFKLKSIGIKKEPYYVLYRPNGEQFSYWIGGFPDARLPIGELYPDVDLNNLLEYAVLNLYGAWAIRMIHYVDTDIWHVELTYGTLRNGEIKKEDKDPALALFWAIWEVIKK
mgnify:CR=1 FL=1